MTIDQQFVEYIIKSLVSDPDAVRVERKVDEKGVLLTLTVAQDDLGRVIGKRGTTAQSIRTLLRALGTKNDARYNLKIVDPSRPDNGEDRVSEGAAVSSESTDNDNSASNDTLIANEEPANTTEIADESNETLIASVETPAAEAVETEAVTDAAEDDHSDVVSKTRRELEELDDLDI